MPYCLEMLERMTKDQKVASLRSYIAYLQTECPDPDFLDALVLVKMFNESAIELGSTSIIDESAALNDFVFSKLLDARDYIDRPYYDQSFDYEATIQKFESNISKDYTKLPVVSAATIFDAISLCPLNSDTPKRVIDEFISKENDGAISHHVVYRMVESKDLPDNSVSVTLLNEATGKRIKANFSRSATLRIFG
ncbi:hypothetical protein AAZU54_08505 [Pseudomonas sp. Je.1.5.c]|uniref:hypothetical protein n=1 Tax=Pseudomonas sp. Je.1.5.c TaxID=3142839 RepID=UPI003DA8AC3C